MAQDALWLPERILDTPAADPAEQAERAETISLAFLIVLERLAPVERAVFLLREVFDHGYDEIAAIVERSPGPAEAAGGRGPGGACAGRSTAGLRRSRCAFHARSQVRK